MLASDRALYIGSELVQAMCGISGIIYKNGSSHGAAPVGRDLVRMLEAMTHRGRDSCGVTVAGQGAGDGLIVRLWIEEPGRAVDVLSASEEFIQDSGGAITSSDVRGGFLRLGVRFDADVPRLAAGLLKIPGVELHSIGHSSEVVKDVGTPLAMDGRHEVSGLRGTHGIGHVRMATESRVDISHAHPFWAYPFPDITVVHNGQLTNYHRLKRAYEDRGHHFQTENDSEIIAVYLADKMANGAALKAALEDSLEELDGTFTYLVSTRDGMGFAKDRWSAKPLVSAETAEVVAVASEEVALAAVIEGGIDRVEPQQKEVMTWSL